jgi:hypothetical protein
MLCEARTPHTIILRFLNIQNKVVVRHQGTTVEVTVAQQLNQGERKKSAVYPCLPAGKFSFLTFLVPFVSRQKVHFT